MSGYTVITGGAGFIGSHLAAGLRREGRALVLVDDLSTGTRANVASLLGDGCELIEASVADALERRPGLLAGAREVYHLAATVGVRRVLQDPHAAIANNLDPTRRVLEAAGTAPVLIASSSEVYGKSRERPLSEEQDLLFGPTSAARWAYGHSKALDEHLGLAAHEAGTPVVIARLFNTIGPGQVGRYGMVVPRFVAAAVAGEPVPVYGDGSQTRSFCDVRDAVRALPALLGAPEQRGRVFNVGSDREIAIDALADRVIALAGGGRKRFVPFEEAYDPGFEEMARRVPALDRVRAAIGFEPAWSLDGTLRDLIERERGACSNEGTA